MITVILALASDGALGHGGDLLWHLRADLRHFKQLTLGHPVIMGRRTWESLPGGALPGRRNIVVSANPDFHAEGAETAPSLQQALEMTAGLDPFIIGGATIYRQALPLADRLELTRIFAEAPHADTRLELDLGCWRLLEASENISEPGKPQFRFESYSRENTLH